MNRTDCFMLSLATISGTETKYNIMWRYLIYLIFPHLGGHDGIERNHEDHHSQASQGAGAEDPPEEVHAEHDAWVGG